MAEQDLSEHGPLLANAGWLRDALHKALYGCLPRLQALLAESRWAFPQASEAQLRDIAESALQQVEGGSPLGGALSSLLARLPAGSSSGPLS